MGGAEGGGVSFGSQLVTDDNNLSDCRRVIVRHYIFSYLPSLSLSLSLLYDLIFSLYLSYY